MNTREQHLCRTVARYFAKRHNGSWFRTACEVAIRDLRNARGEVPIRGAWRR